LGESGEISWSHYRVQILPKWKQRQTKVPNLQRCEGCNRFMNLHGKKWTGRRSRLRVYPKRMKLTVEQEEQVQALLKKFHNSRTVAARLGLTKEYVDNYLKLNGLQ